MPLADVTARKASPRTKSYKLADGNGLYLEIMPNGAKYWRMKYRVAGKEKRLALGVYPEVSLSVARQGREDARRQLAQGIDPSAARKEAKQIRVAKAEAVADTFEVVAREWMAHQDVAEVTANKSRWILETFLFSEIGHRPIAEIKPS